MPQSSLAAKARPARTADNWRFYQDATHKWRWKYVMHGRTVAQAYASYDDFEGCVKDARTHGYRGSAEKSI